MKALDIKTAKVKENYRKSFVLHNRFYLQKYITQKRVEYLEELEEYDPI